MNKITQHIPGFVDGVERKVAEFETVEELRNIEWVVQWLDEPHKHLAQDDELLLVVAGDGKWWWVIGYLQHALPFDQIPTWKGADHSSDHP